MVFYLIERRNRQVIKKKSDVILPMQKVQPFRLEYVTRLKGLILSLTYMMDTYFNRLCDLFECGIVDDKDRELLGSSLFYYCCGKDPSPIIAFGSSYPLYIYSDIVDYGSGSFDLATTKLFLRICDAGYVLVKSRKLQCAGLSNNVTNAVLTLWKTHRYGFPLFSRENTTFCLLYVQSDAVKTFRNVYHDIDKGGNNNYILPKCICNYRYELVGRSDTKFLTCLLNKVEYVFGHCYNDKYKCVAEYDYFGDYGDHNSKIQLFHRKYWYAK